LLEFKKAFGKVENVSVKDEPCKMLIEGEILKATRIYGEWPRY
jgi:hypothetical protein